MRIFLLSASMIAVSSSALGQTCEHYWEFSSTADQVGGLVTTQVGSPVLGVNATYGEAFPGAGPSLNNLVSGTSGGGGHLEASVLSGGASAMDFGQDSFSFSYWAWDDFAGDGDGRGVRVFDNLLNTEEGIQLGTNLANDWNFRVDDDQGAVHIYNVTFQYQAPRDQWYHVVGVVERAPAGGGTTTLYVDGAMVMAIPFVDTQTGSNMAGNVAPTQDLLIGAINGGSNVGGAQSQGLDDLAFYSGALSAADASGLASGALRPVDFNGPVQRYCSPAVPNSTGAPGTVDALGSLQASTNALTLEASSLPANAFGFFLTSQSQGQIAQPG
ncbi:LamG domain-containing protein, partial [Planctomycetota bacterium]|nr:LamG domain-containing protein [Planctomycetota bacterium]